MLFPALRLLLSLVFVLLWYLRECWLFCASPLYGHILLSVAMRPFALFPRDVPSVRLASPCLRPAALRYSSSPLRPMVEKRRKNRKHPSDPDMPGAQTPRCVPNQRPKCSNSNRTPTAVVWAQTPDFPDPNYQRGKRVPTKKTVKLAKREVTL